MAIEENKYTTAFELFLMRNCDDFGILDRQKTFVKLFVLVRDKFL